MDLNKIRGNRENIRRIRSEMGKAEIDLTMVEIEVDGTATISISPAVEELAEKILDIHMSVINEDGEEVAMDLPHAIVDVLTRHVQQHEEMAMVFHQTGGTVSMPVNGIIEANPNAICRFKYYLELI